MKRSAIFVSTMIALTAISCNNKATESAVNDELAAARDSLQIALANQDSLLVLVSDIAGGMDEIRNLEGIISSSVSMNGDMVDERQQIRDDMTAIQLSIANRRQRLAELEARLAKSNANNAHLKQAINTLRAQIADQVSTIESLRGQLAAANIQIDVLTGDIDSLKNTVASTREQRDQALRQNTDLTNELNLCYYAIGSKSELKSHKIIETGFLRKTKIMPDDFEQAYFTPGDKRSLTEIALHSDKARILTNQPADSYEIVTADNGQKTLRITNPHAFWQVSNYVVIQID